MKDEEVRFERRASIWGTGNYVAKSGGSMGARLCSATLRRAVSLPKDNTTMYAVFSEHAHPNAFRITLRSPTGVSWLVYGVDINYMLMLSARQLIQRMYKRGHRYVRIEY